MPNFKRETKDYVSTKIASFHNLFLIFRAGLVFLLLAAIGNWLQGGVS